MVHQRHRSACEFDQARLGFGAHHLHRRDVAAVAQLSPAGAADATAAAGDEARDGGGGRGGGMDQKLASMRPQRGIDVEHQSAGAGADAALAHRSDAGISGHVDQHATLRGYRLAVIGGAAAACGQRQAVFYGGTHHRGDLLLADRAHHDIGPRVTERLAQHRTDRRVVAAHAVEDGGIDAMGNGAEVGEEVVGHGAD
jgi:hypothetical protein